MSEGGEYIPSPEFQFPPPELQIDRDSPLGRQVKERGGGSSGPSDKDRIDGLEPNETWAAWMIPSQDEFNGYSDEGKKFARRVAKRPNALTPINKLQEYYDQLEVMEDKGILPTDEIALFGGRIAARVEELDEIEKQKTSVSGTQSNTDALAVAIDNLNQNLQTMFSKMDKSLQSLETSFSQGQMTPDVFINAMEQQNKKLTEAFAAFGERTPPDVERARWVDMEYRQEFYTQFDPRSEPYFYKNMENEQERRTWDFRWRLARIAFYKKATNAAPERYKESQDVTLFTNEMINVMLERVEGSKEMMQGYLDEILDKDSEFWRLNRSEETERDPYTGEEKIVDMNTERFDRYRQEMRERNKNALILRLADPQVVMLRLSGKLNPEDRSEVFRGIRTGTLLPQDFMAKLSVTQLKLLLDEVDPIIMEELLSTIPQRQSLGKNGRNGQSLNKWLDLKIKEADAVAWNTIYVSNVVEWADSRYTISGGRSVNPLILASDDYRTAHHPQEKFESKSFLGHKNYSTLIDWSFEQLQGAAKSAGVTKVSELAVVPTEDEKLYWRTGSTTKKVLETYYETVEEGGRTVKKKRFREVNKNVSAVYFPEVFPTSSVESFLHYSQVITYDDNQKKWVTDLEKFRTFEPETLGTEEEHPFGLWVATRFDKAIQLNAFYQGKVPLKYNIDMMQLRPAVEEWARPLVDIHQRLKLKEEIARLESQGLTRQRFQAMLDMAVYASVGGMKNPRDAKPSQRIFDPIRKAAVNYNLSSVGYKADKF